MILNRTYDTYFKQYEAIDGLPFPWQAGVESMITGFHERFNLPGSRTATLPDLSIHLSCRKLSNG